MIGATVTWHGQDYELKEVLPHDGYFVWDPVFAMWSGTYTFRLPGEGYRDWEQGGIWVPGELTETEIEAIIRPTSQLRSPMISYIRSSPPRYAGRSRPGTHHPGTGRRP